MLILVIAILFLAVLPALMTASNLRAFRVAPRSGPDWDAALRIPVSVLIPARNEEASIAAALESLRTSTHPAWEVIVLDDASEDRTGDIVTAMGNEDPRVQLRASRGLEVGWNGKQNACWQLAHLARYDHFLFLDADVRLSSDALTRCVAEMVHRQAALVSGFPRQETGTFAEKLLIPLMHTVLLGYLPIDRMRASTDPGFAAGCGQLFLAERSTYFSSGGHSAIPASRHDGIKLPRAYRNAGLRTDVFDATDIATCRMYHSLHQVVRGLLKNAVEGIANAKLIVPFSILLVGGFVLPCAVLAWLVGQGAWGTWSFVLAAIATVLSYGVRAACALRFRQSWLGVLFHPFAVLWFVALQWVALAMHALRIQTRWRGRVG